MKKSDPHDNPYRKRKGVKPMSAEEAQKRLNGVELEKKDIPAMIIAAFTTFLPALVVVIGLLVWLLYHFIIR